MASLTPSTLAPPAPEKRMQLPKDPPLRCRQLAEQLQPTTLVQLGAICLTSLTIGLSDIPPLASFETPTSPNNASTLLQITYTVLPFLLGSILAVAFLDPLVRTSPRFGSHPFSLLAFANLLIGSAHALLLLMPHPSCDRTIPPLALAVCYFLTGVGNAISLVIVTLLCCRQTRGGMLGIMHATVALGAMLGAAIAGVETDIGDGSITTTPAGGRKGLSHLVALALALLNTALLHTASQSSDDETLPATPSSAESQPPNNTTPPTKPDDTTPPPPPSNTTLLTALLTLLHLTTITTLPSWLATIPTNAAHHHHHQQQPSLAYTTAALWTGLTLGRFFFVTIIPPCSDTRTRRLERVISSALGLVTVGFLVLVLFWLAQGNYSNMGGNAGMVAGAGALVVGFALGPVYTWAVGRLLGGEMGDGERVGAVGIVVAFGHAGAVGGLVMVRLAACLEGTVVLHLVVGGAFGGMVLCLKILMGNEGDVEGV